MKKSKSRVLSDVVIGVALTLAVAVIYLGNFSLFDNFEYKLYDFRASLRQNTQLNKNIVIVAIDDASIEKMGRWPWPRSILADLVSRFSASGARVIGANMVFSEPDKNQGLLEIQAMQERYFSLLSQGLDDVKKLRIRPSLKGDVETAVANTFDSIFLDLHDVESRLDNDTKFAAAISEAGNIVLPMFFNIGQSLSDTEDRLPQFLSRNVITNFEISSSGLSFSNFVPVNTPVLPIDIFAEHAVGIGHINIIPDFDGVIRRSHLAVKCGSRIFPSFALQIAHMPVGCGLEGVTVSPGSWLSIGAKIKIFTDKSGALLIDYSAPGETYKYFSAFDVLNDKVPEEVFRDKIVLLGITATGIADLHVTPVGHNVPGIEIIANSIDNLIEQRFLTRPGKAFYWELGALLLVGMFVTLLLPSLKARTGALLSMALVLLIIVPGFYVFIKYGYWLKLFPTLFLLIAGYIIITSKHFLITERGKELVEAESIETNKMLGLSFQGQGMLDIAFEKFRKCPVDDSMKDVLYNLGLDYERKRQFNKAIAVYEHILTVDTNYKGLDARIKSLKTASDAVVIGGASQMSGTVIVGGDGTMVQRPTLGRYEIIKELGRGAMGTVYLGEDPKIKRKVAIKTLRFDDDVPETQIKAVKERFFREAESAGRLSHPNIIKIFDAGEDQEVAYIAMELLDGIDLKEYCEKSKLLPRDRVLELLAQIADALDYAHEQGVVHRDIKPANIMLLKDGAVRVTDFGIARIAASSKTQTGTILGTPSYMSPEQIAGAKADGRADIFSLGVIMFEMLTGEKPFKGDGIAQLLFQITNQPHPNPKELNPEIPDCCVAVIDKALRKKAEERYARAGEMAAAVKNCMGAVT